MKKSKKFQVYLSAIALAVILLTSIFVSNGALAPKEEVKEEEVLDVSSVAKEITLPDNQITSSKAESKTESITVAIKEEEPSLSEAVNVEIPPDKLIMPVDGEISVPYSQSVVYSKTLKEWRTHRAIDISAPQAEKVVCAADGIIKAIYTDPAWGITIEVEHEGGMITVYKNLSTDIMAEEGMTVSCGDIISGVGTSAPIEMLQDPHLHFEVWLNGELIDPTSYF